MTSRYLSHSVLCLLAIVAVVAVTAAGCGRQVASATKYHCPMHPTYVSDRPGDCPICGMRLVPIGETTQPAAAKRYVCPMHPHVVSDKPGECPECGMDLVPVDQVERTKGAATPAGRKPLYYRSPMDPAVTSPVPAKDSMGMDFIPVYADEAAAPSGVPGMAPVAIGPEGLRLAGVQTAPVARERFVRSIRAVGTVAADARRVRHVHTKVGGWVEQLHVNFTGQFVQKGDPLLSIYSRELLAGQEEYLRAREAAARFATSTLPEVRKGGQDLVQAARRRLELFDVPEDQIAALERTGAPARAVTLVAPVSGFVTSKNTFEGQEISPSMDLFTITDLSHVWIEADFYEYEAQQVRLGQVGKVTLASNAGRTLSGRVSYIDPTVNPETRTLRVRFEFPNPALALKPAMFVDVELEIDSGLGLVIPDSAVLDTGERQIVFVTRGEGQFEPRLVRVGARSAGKALVLSGLAPGEQVVIRANFLLDSESRLRAVIAGLQPSLAGTPAGDKK